MNSIISWPAHPPEPDSAETPLRGKTAFAVRKQKKFAKRLPSASVPSLIKPALGPLECEVLQQVCGNGELSARQVLERIPRPLAYTTVMTTLSRLYRKGWLDCRAPGKTFLYSSRLGSAQVETQLARDLLRALARCRSTPIHELVEAIIETVGGDYPELLAELQRALSYGSSIEFDG